jgi:alanine-glyoxylate transaminase/serine-glyoxylate transaminase/serine-pyruvate transaminase
MVIGTLSGVEVGLEAASIPHRAGGVQAAMDYLQENRVTERIAAE